MEIKKLITKVILDLSKISVRINPASAITVLLIYFSIILIKSSYLYDNFIF